MTDPVYVARRPLSRNPWFGRGDGVALWGRIAGDDDLNAFDSSCDGERRARRRSADAAASSRASAGARFGHQTVAIR